MNIPSKVIQSINRKYFQHVKELESDYSIQGTSNFRHVTRNLLQIMYDQAIPEFERDRQRHSTYTQTLTELKLYLHLIVSSSEYREQEVRAREFVDGTWVERK